VFHVGVFGWRLTRRALLGAGAVAAVGVAPGRVRAALSRDVVVGLQVGNGRSPYAGDGPLLTTITPNGDGLRDRAVVRFTLTEPATVTFQVARTTKVPHVIYTKTLRVRPGSRAFSWAPTTPLNPRTYVTLLSAVDVAGNVLVTDPVTLAAIPANVKVRISSVPVYLKGHKDADSMLGALNAVRSASGTVSLDLRPLAVGRGSYRVEIRLKSGKRSKRFKKTYKVGRTGALPRISTSLSKATAKTTITLTVRKKSGRRWAKYAGTRLVLKK